MLHRSKATKRGSVKKGACLRGTWADRAAETSLAIDSAMRAPIGRPSSLPNDFGL